MSSSQENIHPIFEDIIQRADKEKLLKQKARVLWLTGLSGSGKSTLAKGLEKELYRKGFITKLLDGDNVRTGINNNLGFSQEDRNENIRRISEISKLFLNCGIICINCFVSPTKDIRELAKSIIGEEDYLEVFVNASLASCEERDVKGLYAKARKGEIKDFTGINAPFDIPESPSLEIKTDELTEVESLKILVDFVLPKIEVK